MAIDLYDAIQKSGVQHCSFDFWNTIGTSNSLFKNSRNRLIADSLNVSEQAVADCFISVGASYNLTQESGLRTVIPRALTEHLMRTVTMDETLILDDTVYQSFINLFREFPPILRNDVAKAIESCYEGGVSVSITSNTAFVPGQEIDRYLEKVFGDGKPAFGLYSDEVGVAKPNQRMFELCHQSVSTLKSCPIPASAVMHIGDSMYHDYAPARAYGMEACIV